MFKLALVLCTVGLLTACTTSPTGRSQLILLPESQLNAMGLQAFEDIKKDTPIVDDPDVNRYVQCIVDPITREVDAISHKQYTWEVVVLEDDTPNAFALPGGKIGIHTGIMEPDISANADQLAAVIGHEIAHVLANHGGERVSHQVASQLGLAAVQVATQNRNSQKNQLLLGALGLGAQYGVLLPFSRAHETEADVYGIMLTSKAGFDPRESIELWQNMANASQGQTPPEWLSTHPNPQTRIENLSELIDDEAYALYQSAQRAGKRPNCQL